jgi:precorrin-2 methylase
VVHLDAGETAYVPGVHSVQATALEAVLALTLA